MNLSDLNKIDINDLKNIDWESAKDRLLSQPGLAINMFIIAVTAVAIFSVYRTQADKVKTIQSKITQLQKKTQALNKLETAQKQYDEFLKNTPLNITTNQLIEKLSEFALKWNVQILSFSPAEERGNSNFSVTNVMIDIRSENYENIVLFMHEIENSPYFIRIGGLSGQVWNEETRRGRRRSRQTFQSRTDEAGAEKKYVQAVIEIESVEFKDG